MCTCFLATKPTNVDFVFLRHAYTELRTPTTVYIVIAGINSGHCNNAGAVPTTV